MPVSRELLKPVSTGFIVFTFVVGLLLALIPWGQTVRWVLPDTIALLLLYWTLNQPRHVGVSWAFFLGLVLDIADGNSFGQHGFAYCLMTYLILARRRQLVMFPMWHQSLYIGPLLLISQVGMVLARLIVGDPFPGWLYFSASLSGALLWPLMSSILQIPQRKEKPAEL